MTRRKQWLFGAVATIGALTLLLAGFEVFSYYRMKSLGWLSDWRYLTMSDPRLGFTLRPDISLIWTGAETVINRSGVRDDRRNRVVRPKRSGEVLIFAVGDSNTFGNGVPFDRTYPGWLAKMLQGRLPARVRVVNLGVSGYSSFQARLRLAQWIHLKPDYVIIADCFNDRAHVGRVDSPEAFAREHQSYRRYEIGRRILYSVLYVNTLLAEPVQSELPSITEPLPTPRVPLEMFRDNLLATIRLCREHGAVPILLATGDDRVIEGRAQLALKSLREGDWTGAEARFKELTEIRPGWFLNWYYYYRSHLENRGLEGAGEIADRYAERVDPDYMAQFVHYASEYIDVMRQVAEEQGVELVDLREAFADKQVRFVDASHYFAEGHYLAARRLTARITALSRKTGAGG